MRSIPGRTRAGLGNPLLLIGLCSILALPVGAAAQVPAAYVPLTIDQLQPLAAPVALYPDALLAQVLAASTYPDDVIAAARWEDAGNNPAGIDAQPWDSSVKGVARYPAILHYMASNADWMNQLGGAFLNQQADVMAAVQDLRARALAVGTLTSTPQQTVINQDGYIQIIPTDPQYLCAPIYDAGLIYSPPPIIAGVAYPSYITFGPPIEVGDWLDFDLDWHDHALYSGHWGRDRPWWRHDASFRYLNDRPGIYRPGAFRDAQNHPIEAQAGRWERDNRRPPPRPMAAPARPALERPERGYAPAPPEVQRPLQTGRSADVARQSQRGQASRQETVHNQPRPEPQRAPGPVRPAPRPEPQRAPEPARPAPRPAPEARPSAPTRGGAVGGYQNGQAAQHSAERGAASRGK
jgi:hypothetical protein